MAEHGRNKAMKNEGIINIRIRKSLLEEWELLFKQIREIEKLNPYKTVNVYIEVGFNN